jgi:hypothetical protein
MNTPEKLTMLGFRKADPDAELKPVSPRAWQALWINPVAGQPEADLRAVGYRREYGAATRGEYGPVIWTSLCFDRKQFVAAFVTGGGNDAADRRTSRRRPSRERAESAINELYRHGIPDPIDKSDAELVSAVEAKIRERKQKAVSSDTILRAAGRRK